MLRRIKIRMKDSGSEKHGLSKAEAQTAQISPFNRTGTQCSQESFLQRRPRTCPLPSSAPLHKCKVLPSSQSQEHEGLIRPIRRSEEGLVLGSI